MVHFSILKPPVFLNASYIVANDEMRAIKSDDSWIIGSEFNKVDGAV